MIEYKESPDHWRVSIGKRCRFIGGPDHQHCGRPAIVECHRGRWTKTWWAYCQEHSLGRVVHDGEVWYVERRDG